MLVYIRASSLENCMQRKCAFANQLVYLNITSQSEKEMSSVKLEDKNKYFSSI